MQTAVAQDTQNQKPLGTFWVDLELCDYLPWYRMVGVGKYCLLTGEHLSILLKWIAKKKKKAILKLPLQRSLSIWHLRLMFLWHRRGQEVFFALLPLSNATFCRSTCKRSSSMLCCYLRRTYQYSTKCWPTFLLSQLTGMHRAPWQSSEGREAPR